MNVSGELALVAHAIKRARVRCEESAALLRDNFAAPHLVAALVETAESIGVIERKLAPYIPEVDA